MSDIYQDYGQAQQPYQQPPPSKSFFQKHKAVIVVVVALALVAIIVALYMTFILDNRVFHRYTNTNGNSSMTDELNVLSNVSTMDNCEKKCLEEDGCLIYGWNSDDNRCKLYKPNSNYVPNHYMQLPADGWNRGIDSTIAFEYPPS